MSFIKHTQKLISIIAKNREVNTISLLIKHKDLINSIYEEVITLPFYLQSRGVIKGMKKEYIQNTKSKKERITLLLAFFLKELPQAKDQGESVALITTHMVLLKEFLDRYQKKS